MTSGDASGVASESVPRESPSSGKSTVASAASIPAKSCPSSTTVKSSWTLVIDASNSPVVAGSEVTVNLPSSSDETEINADIPSPLTSSDSEGVASSFHAKGFSAHDVRSNASDPNDTLTGQLLGLDRENWDAFGVPQESYAFANKRMSWEVIDPFLRMASPLRTAHIRDPQGPQTTYSSEAFMDEIAAEVGADPIEFRLRYLTDDRDIEVVTTVAEQAGWESRPSPNPSQDDPDVLVGRGMAYAQRDNTVVAIVCEVEVNRETGRVWPRRFTVAHDCGLIVNPRALTNTIEGAVLQSTSRTLFEEVQFDENNVTSVDWASYPILDIIDAPEEIKVALIDRPELPPYGAGEPAVKPVAGAIANAIFDATGVRIRRVPFRPDRVKAAMDANA